MVSATRGRGFSLKEAAVPANVPERTIRKALETRTITPSVTRVGRVPRYCFRAHDLLYLTVVHEFPIALSTADRLDLWCVFEGHRTGAGPWMGRCALARRQSRGAHPRQQEDLMSDPASESS